MGDIPFNRRAVLTGAGSAAARTATVDPMTDTAPTMGLAQAARACGISVSTLRRRRATLEAAGATVADSGWVIPVPALVSLGYLSGTTAPPDSSQRPGVAGGAVSPTDGPVVAPSELEELRARLADAERRAAVAEAVAAERERLIQSQASALRMLEGGTPATPPPASPDSSHDTPGPVTPETPPMPSDRRTAPVRAWFRRRRR